MVMPGNNMSIHLLQVCRLLHDIFASELVSAPPKNFAHCLRQAVTYNYEIVGPIGMRIVFIEKRTDLLHPRIVFPLRIRNILGIGR